MRIGTTHLLLLRPLCLTLLDHLLIHAVRLGLPVYPLPAPLLRRHLLAEEVVVALAQEQDVLGALGLLHALAVLDLHVALLCGVRGACGMDGGWVSSWARGVGGYRDTQSADGPYPLHDAQEGLAVQLADAGILLSPQALGVRELDLPLLGHLGPPLLVGLRALCLWGSMWYTPCR
jgi:hypothetical protein